MMNQKQKVLRLVVSIGVIGGAYLARPRTIRPDVFLLIVFIGILVLNLALSWGQSLRRGQARPEPGGAAPGRRTKAWLLFWLSIGIGTGLGAIYAQESRSWLFIPAGVLAGLVLGSQALKKFR